MNRFTRFCHHLQTMKRPAYRIFRCGLVLTDLLLIFAFLTYLSAAPLSAVSFSSWVSGDHFVQSGSVILLLSSLFSALL